MFANRTEQTTQTTGTGTVDLIPALTGRSNFSDTIGNGNACYYIIQTSDESQWEEGWGVVTAGSPDQLTRNTVVASSNGNTLVNFPSGTKTVFIGDNADTLRFGHVGQLPTTGGTATALTVAYAPPLRHLRAGMVFRFIAGTSSTDAATTLSINALPSVDFLELDGEGLSEKSFTVGNLLTVSYDGLSVRLISSRSSSSITSEILEAKEAAVAEALLAAYPVGSIYLNASNGTNPGTLLGFGTWVSLGAARVLIGVGTDTDGTNALTVAAGATGGEYKHSLTEAENAQHRHQVAYATTATSGGLDANRSINQNSGGGLGNNDYYLQGTTAEPNVGKTSQSGSGTAHNNIQPYIGVYMWKRTA